MIAKLLALAAACLLPFGHTGHFPRHHRPAPAPPSSCTMVDPGYGLPPGCPPFSGRG